MAYRVTPGCESRGYATEAARALVEIAFGSDDVQVVIARTSERANASSRVLSKIGFACTGPVIDPEDGTVWQWERTRKDSVGDVAAEGRSPMRQPTP